MSQVNKYADKAGYTADKNRKDTQSAVSYVEDDGVLIYDGVNTVIRKSAAGVGDLVVFDKTDSTLKFIKGDTLVTEKIPPQLIPGGRGLCPAGRAGADRIARKCNGRQPAMGILL